MVTLILYRSLLVKFQYFSSRLLRAPILHYLECCPSPSRLPAFLSTILSESSDSCLTHLDLFCPFPGVQRTCMNQFKLARRNSQQPAYVQILCPNHQYGKPIEKTYTKSYIHCIKDETVELKRSLPIRIEHIAQ